MNSTMLEPKKLRPELIQRVETMDDESLLVLHRALLIVEKERLWRELPPKPNKTAVQVSLTVCPRSSAKRAPNCIRDDCLH